MSGFSPDDAIAMERRHIREGEKRIARQEALVKKLTEKGSFEVARLSKEVLTLLRASQELSINRLRYLKCYFGNRPGGWLD